MERVIANLVVRPHVDDGPTSHDESRPVELEVSLRLTLEVDDSWLKM
jgi:hypothetical protein